MSSHNKFWSGILLGAIAGGALSLVDKETRQAMGQCLKKGSENITHYVTHPTEVVEKVKYKTEGWRTTMSQLSEDVSFISGKINELREVTPKVAQLVGETKEAFTETKNEH